MPAAEIWIKLEPIQRARGRFKLSYIISYTPVALDLIRIVSDFSEGSEVGGTEPTNSRYWACVRVWFNERTDTTWRAARTANKSIHLSLHEMQRHLHTQKTHTPVPLMIRVDCSHYSDATDATH